MVIRCSCFGHRNVLITKELYEQAKQIFEYLITNKNVTEFLFGSKSDFDDMCYDVVNELKQIYPFIRRVVYTCRSEAGLLDKDKNAMEKAFFAVTGECANMRSFDEIRTFDTVMVAGVSSYIQRNRAIIDDSDFCVFYYDTEYKPPQNRWRVQSGTALAYKYANSKKKHIFNLKDKNC